MKISLEGRCLELLQQACECDVTQITQDDEEDALSGSLVETPYSIPSSEFKMILLIIL